MYEWIEPYWNYYYLMIIVSLFIGLIASYVHNSAIPLLYTGFLSAILHWGYKYLNPMIEGVYNFDWTFTSVSVLSGMLLIFSISWILIMILTHLNLIKEGEVLL